MVANGPETQFDTVLSQNMGDMDLSLQQEVSHLQLQGYDPSVGQFEPVINLHVRQENPPPFSAPSPPPPSA